MLTSSEFEQLKNFSVSKPGLSKQAILKYIEENLLQGGLNANPFKDVRKPSVHVINPNRNTVDNTRKREQEKGFKVRTQGESEQADTRSKGR